MKKAILPSAAPTRQAEALDHHVTVVPVGFERLYEEVREGDVVYKGELLINSFGFIAESLQVRGIFLLVFCSIQISSPI